MRPGTPDLRRPCHCGRGTGIGPHYHSLQEGCLYEEPVETVDDRPVLHENGIKPADVASEPADPVEHPPHYVSHPSGIECIQITEHMSFCLGNAVKYIWRADEKGNALEDLRKARWYIDREIARREAQQDAAAPEQPAAGPERQVCGDETTGYGGARLRCAEGNGHEPPHRNGTRSWRRGGPS